MKVKVRLPQQIKPEHYDIQIKPDLDKFTFEGEETIRLVLEKETKQLTLHAHELDVQSAEIENQQAGKISYDKKTETVTIAFPKKLTRGKAKLKLFFRGFINDKMMGFYRSKYTHEGEEKHLATTQFEATYARRAFPCFDEPAMKATFDLSLIIPRSLTAISNTVITEVAEHEGGYKVVKFATTPKMSTYLLAYIVGDFEYVEGKTEEGVKVRVFVTPGKKSQAKFALEVGIKCIEFYNEYFQIPYPLPVMDMIAIPDFAHGAMENWGAVTYRESTLLVDADLSSAANKQWVALVIAHELAHQWFGNLVTMEWWTHLWLNEGFASFIEYLAIDHIFPQWDIWTQFVYLEQGTALRLDSLKNTHPIEIDVHNPAEISEAFDRVSYSKGASVLRMLSEFLGFETFRKGLRLYLKRHAYGNAATGNLWKALEEASGKPVGKIMKNWTGKGGYPVVSLKNGKLTQERFFSSSISKKKSKDTTLWSIPLNVLTAKGIDKYQVQGKSAKLSMGSFTKLNASDAAFIRVNYSKDHLEELKQALMGEKFSAVDRLGLVRDVFDLVEPGYVETTLALEFVKAYEEEEDYTIWLEIASHLSSLQGLFVKESFYDAYGSFAKQIFSKVVSKVGWKKKRGESHTRVMLRSLVLASAGKYGDKDTIKTAKLVFSSPVIDPDLRGVVYDLVAENGGVKEYNYFLGRYKKEINNQERDRLGRALGSFKDQALLQKTLDFSLSGEVRLQDIIHMINRVWVNPHGRQLAWNFVKKNWKRILEKFGGKHDLWKLISTASIFTTSKEAKDVEKFFRKNPVPGAKRTLAQALEQIYSNEAWLKRDRQKISNFLVK